MKCSSFIRLKGATIVFGFGLLGASQAQDGYGFVEEFEANVTLSIENVVTTVDAVAAICELNSRLISDDDSEIKIGKGAAAYYLGDPVGLGDTGFSDLSDNQIANDMDVTLVEFDTLPSQITVRVYAFDDATSFYA